MPRRLAEVVLPLDEGPEMSTMRVPRVRLASRMASAVWANLRSWKASASLIMPPASPASTFELTSPTVGTPMMRTHDWYSRKMSNIFSWCTSLWSRSGAVRSGSER